MSYQGPTPPPNEEPGAHQPGSYGWNPQSNTPYGGAAQPSPYPPYGSPSPYAAVAQPGTLPLRALTLGDYFSGLFATIRKSPGLFFGAALIFGSVAAVITATGEFFLLRSFGATMADPFATADQLFTAGGSIGFFGSILLSQLVLMVGQTFNWGMYSIMLGRGAIDMKTSLSQGFRLLRGQWGKLVGLLALMVAAVIVIYLVMALLLVLVAAAVFAGGEPDSGGAIAAAIFGFLLAVILPAIAAVFFAIRWHLVIPAMVVEDIGIFAALRRSWGLTRGYFWRTLGIALLFGIILGFVSVVITGPLSFLGSFVLMSAGTEGQLLTSMLITNLIITAVSSLVGFIVTNMGLLISIMFYYDYRFRKEGLGIHFQQLAAQRATGSVADRFDTSGQQGLSSNDETDDLVPGRFASAASTQPGGGYPPTQYPPYAGPTGPADPSGPPQAPPNPPGPRA
ncbi:glycerophosphoryl diester phosphodiesterase membrane domain-containing protein [Enteractinococcus helveticum]|uniref:DUF7847 domain-containing protein n=1 Tax=Enteractinococcus helveticum TaxID=1837282 RepID=A0A1B7LWT0_9MICC|nr:glycerophosphoryl diester phosphodiesterase membrane domain-containing protein [Enteractinococcus helveticum]OAV59514.1 hypothetical protein A6F49_16900 [Enteractinococcus helveticum]